MICIKPQKHRKVAQQNSPRGECRGGGEGGGRTWRTWRKREKWEGWRKQAEESQQSLKTSEEEQEHAASPRFSTHTSTCAELCENL